MLLEDHRKNTLLNFHRSKSIVLLSSVFFLYSSCGNEEGGVVDDDDGINDDKKWSANSVVSSNYVEGDIIVAIATVAPENSKVILGVELDQWKCRLDPWIMRKKMHHAPTSPLDITNDRRLCQVEHSWRIVSTADLEVLDLIAAAQNTILVFGVELFSQWTDPLNL